MPVLTNQRKMSQGSKSSKGKDSFTLIESEKRSQGRSQRRS